MMTSFPSGLTRLSLVLAGSALLGACGVEQDPLPSNPNTFTAAITDGTLTGHYDPAGFTATEVQALLAANCMGKRLASYGEDPAGALVSFAATCEGGTGTMRGNYEFRRAGA